MEAEIPPANFCGATRHYIPEDSAFRTLITPWEACIQRNTFFWTRLYLFPEEGFEIGWALSADGGSMVSVGMMSCVAESTIAINKMNSIPELI